MTFIRYKDPIEFPLIEIGNNKYLRQREDESWIIGTLSVYLGSKRFCELGIYSGSLKNE